MDHFQLIRDYNHLVEFELKVIVVLFFMYSMVISYWAITIKSCTAEFEFVVVETTVVFFTVLFFSGAALARHANFRLYTLIGKAMAIDTGLHTKKRWITIMNFYKPRPLYCFMLSGSTEVSWLFCLKVSYIESYSHGGS